MVWKKHAVEQMPQSGMITTHAKTLRNQTLNVSENIHEILNPRLIHFSQRKLLCDFCSEFLTQLQRQLHSEEERDEFNTQRGWSIDLSERATL